MGGSNLYLTYLASGIESSIGRSEIHQGTGAS